MAFTVGTATKTTIDGQKYWTWLVVETSVDASDEWVIQGLPPFFTITLFECAWDGAGPTDTIDPELGLASGWAAASIDHIADNEEPAAHVRTSCDLHVTAVERSLYGRSNPSATAGIVRTRLTIREGH